MAEFQSPRCSEEPRLRVFLLILSVVMLIACGEPPGPAAPAPPPAPTLRPDQADLMIKALEEAPSHGFRPGAFPTADIAGQIHSPDPAEQAKADQTLIARTLVYARALHGLAIPAHALPQAWDVRPPDYDAAGDFRRALEQDRLPDWLAALPPPSDEYRTIRAAYQAYLKIIADGGWRPLAEGPVLHVGNKGAHVTALRKRLAIEDPALANPQSDGAFDEDLAAAVRRAELRYGLHETGEERPELVAALNVPAETRAAQLRANLERLRWLPRDQPSTRIVVNSAADTFDFFSDGTVAMHMLAAAGKPGDETPMLTSAIEAIVINPAWHVPDSIARRELYPKQRADRGYFARHGYIVRSRRIVQRPGPRNALGQVKFEFPNPFSVYLHDTPTRSVFASSKRAVSHGCVRLERARDLAERLLSETPESSERLEEALASKGTVRIELPHPIPVGLYYFTAFPDEGQVAFRDDVYGWDEKLLRLLDAGPTGQA
jgi:murein L,D-transpeptidase YcbB/YkuD